MRYKLSSLRQSPLHMNELKLSLSQKHAAALGRSEVTGKKKKYALDSQRYKLDPVSVAQTGTTSILANKKEKDQIH